MNNWKTTLCGFLAAIFVAVIPILQSGTVEVKNLLLAVAIAAMGWFSKDFTSTGTTKA